MAIMGRPREITEEMIDSARVWLAERSNMGIHTLLPTIEGLALYLKISRETVYAWEEDGGKDEASELLQDFSDIVRELRSSQAEKLMQNSLQNKYNPMISKLLLSKHGYVEKSEQDITSGGSKVSQPIDMDMVTQFMMMAKDQTKQ